MAKGTRICKVCGKEYEYCHTWNNTNKFRYQDVACSPECGAKYFAAIEASRAASKKEEDAPKETPKKAGQPKIDFSKTADEFTRVKEFDDVEAVG